MSLTNDQNEALKQVIEFLKSVNKIFILKGYAGTGKTTLIKRIIEEVKTQNLNYQLMTPTGRSSYILSKKTNNNSQTIHSTIYALNNAEDETETSNIIDYDEDLQKLVFKLKNETIFEDTIYIIDEASMISTIKTRNKILEFGTGNLLTDILTYTNIIESNNKIIFVGDPLQLPPIHETEAKVLFKKTFTNLQPVKEYTLKEVVRQQKDSGIINNANILRSHYENETNNYKFKSNFSDIMEVTREEMIHKIIEDNENLGYSSIIITRTNEKAADLNRAYRHITNKPKEEISVGDKIIISQNNYGDKRILYNGLFGIVTEVNPNCEIFQKIPVKNSEGEQVNVDLKFRKIKILIQDEIEPEDILIFENHLFHEPYSLEDSKALIKNFYMRNSKNKSKKEIQDAIRKDEYLNAIKLKFGHAITCHKAQGGEWENVYIEEQNTIIYYTKKENQRNSLNWIYTAITRASKKLYVLKSEKRSSAIMLKDNIFQNSNLKEFSSIKYPSKGTTIDQKIQIILMPNEQIAKIGAGNQQPFQRKKLNELYSLTQLTSKLNIIKLISNQYQERYILESEGQTVGINLTYNGKGTYTNISISQKESKTPEFSKSIFELLSKEYLFVTSVTDRCDSIDLNYEFQSQMGMNICLTLLPYTNKQEINLIDIQSHQYHEILTFQKNHEITTIRFWYDSKGIITKIYPIVKEKNVEAINKILLSILENLQNGHSDDRQ